MAETLAQQLPLALYWIGYAVLHSLLAANPVKRALAASVAPLRRHYRFAYNVLALVLLLPAPYLLHATPGPQMWSWEGLPFWALNGFAALAVALLFLRPVGYDTRGFAGLGPEATGFVISGWHRFVRHPWYCVGLLVLWTRDMDLATLVSACLITAYLIVGSRLEEAKLIDTIGEPYRQYRARVSGLIPLPWKILDAETARRLSNSSGTRG